jgi:hypothetical protein
MDCDGSPCPSATASLGYKADADDTFNPNEVELTMDMGGGGTGSCWAMIEMKPIEPTADVFVMAGPVDRSHFTST